MTNDLCDYPKYVFDRKAMTETTISRRYNVQTKEYELSYRVEKVYSLKEIQSAKFQEIIGEARQLWRKRCDEYVLQNPKPTYGGCCHMHTVGIKVLSILPKCRIPKCIIVLSPEFGYQGEHVWTGSADEIVEFLKSKDINCFFHCGALD